MLQVKSIVECSLTSPTPKTLMEQGGGAHGYLALNSDIPVIATNRDPTIYEYDGKPNNEHGAYATIHSGGVQVAPDAYMTAVQALRPDLWVSLCDEIPSSGEHKVKRLRTQVDRTTKWLDACLSKIAADPDLSTSALAAVGGGHSKEERSRAAAAAAERPVAGFALCGFGTGEEPESRPELIQAAVEKLPEDKPRLIQGMANPHQVLDAIAEGLDLFDNAYVDQVTSGGFALHFPLDRASSTSDRQVDRGGDPMKRNLWSTEYRTDKGPLVQGCTCYTCKRHNRAYIHHLLQSNEMLADVLLELHNTHHYTMFMQQVRQAVQEGTLQQYTAWFKSISGVAMSGQDHVEAPNRASLKRSFVAVIDKASASPDYKRAHQAPQ